jgi:cobalt-zinc-cadmium efflux system membrane fusion protein
MFATFKIATGAPQSSPAVPVNAVIWEGETANVWVERENHVFQRHQVKAGMEQDGFLQIRDGLEVGDRVVARGAIYVQNEWKQ